MRALVAVLTLSLLTTAALASTPQVEAAVKAFQSLASEADRLKTFCALIEIEQENEENAGPLLATKMVKCSMSLERISKQLGRVSKILIQHPRTAKFFMRH